MEPIIERDMPECETWNMTEEGTHEEEEEKKTIVEMMMGEEYDKYFWNEKHAL